MLTVIYSQCHIKAPYAEYHYVECQYAECYYVDCHYAACRYAECHYASCRYAECRGAKIMCIKKFTKKLFYLSYFTHFVLSLPVSAATVELEPSTLG